MKIYLLIIGFAFTSNAFGGARECDWATAVNKDNPTRINAFNQQIALRQSLIARENEVLEKQLNPQLQLVSHTLAVYDANSNVQRQAQLIINQALVYMKRSLVSGMEIQQIFDRLGKQSTLRKEILFSDQIRREMSSLTISEATREQLANWIYSLDLLEAALPDWNQIERDVIEALPSSQKSFADTIVSQLESLNARLDSEVRVMADARVQDQLQKEQLEQAVALVQQKISQYLNEIQDHKKQIEFWMNQIRANSPVTSFCPQIEYHFLR